MKRWGLLLALFVAVGAGAATAQTRVSVSLGFGDPRPYASGFVVIGEPDPYFYYRPVYRRWYGYHRWGAYRRDVIVLPARPLVVYRRPYARRHHRRW